MTDLEARTSLQEYFPSFAVETVDELGHPGEGADAFLINGDTVFRFPASKDAAARLRVELSLLPKLASILPLPVPNYCNCVTGPDGQPLCAYYPLLPGEPLTPERFKTLAADTPWSNETARKLGTFLTALHSSPVQEAVSCGLAESRYPLIEQVVRRNASVRASIYPLLDPPERELLNVAFKGLLWELRDYDPPPVPCHGRLSARRMLLVQGRDELSGVVGWGSVKLGDPAVDFTWRREFGDDFYYKVLEYYDRPVPEPEQFARVVAYHCQLLPVDAMSLALRMQDQTAFQGARRRLTAESEP